MNVIYNYFEERIEPNVRNAELADLWPIEIIFGIMKEKCGGKKFENLASLVRFASSE